MCDKVGVYIETYGCSANQSHSEVMLGLLEKSGYIITKKPELADILIINTCIVKEPTEKRMVNRIKDLKKKYSEKRLIIAGCMPKAEYNLVKSIAPEASLIGPNNCLDVERAVKEASKKEYIDEKYEEKLCLAKKRQNPFINISEISQGCLGNCSYCIVRRAKGKLKSYPPEKILEDIKMSLKNRCSEIWLTSQDCGCYGLDISVTLVDLLKNIIEIPEKFKIRIGMSNPNHILHILEDLIKCYKSDKIYGFLHIPVQSGSDKVLKKMNRQYSVVDFEKIVTKFRHEIPNITIWTDVIVGFPSETEEDFKETLRLIKEIKPDFVNISKFGIRPGTPAEKIIPLSGETIKKRCKNISDIAGKISLEKNKEWIGRKCEIFVTERGKKPNQLVGRNKSYKPVIVTGKKLGKFVTVKIIDARKTHLIGSVI